MLGIILGILLSLVWFRIAGGAALKDFDAIIGASAAVIAAAGAIWVGRRQELATNKAILAAREQAISARAAHSIASLTKLRQACLTADRVAHAVDLNIKRSTNTPPIFISHLIDRISGLSSSVNNTVIEDCQNSLMIVDSRLLDSFRLMSYVADLVSSPFASTMKMVEDGVRFDKNGKMNNSKTMYEAYPKEFCEGLEYVCKHIRENSLACIHSIDGFFSRYDA